MKVTNLITVCLLAVGASAEVKKLSQNLAQENDLDNVRNKRSVINTINKWAAESTDSKLPEITKDVKNTDDAMIVNAMSFKPHWDEKFNHKMINNRRFHVLRSKAISVQMINHTGLYGFYEDKENKLYVLDMPLAHKKFSVIFIMPYRVKKLKRLEKLLTRDQLNTWISKLKETAVVIFLPNIIMEVSYDLQKHLGEMGLTEAVDKSKADLSNISGNKDLYLLNVFNASAGEWDTEGNPSDTSIFGSEKLRNPRLFYANHPFIFVVKDNQTNSILYISRLV